MGAVDRPDKMLSSDDCMRKSINGINNLPFMSLIPYYYTTKCPFTVLGQDRKTCITSSLI